tara:strand:+ start:21 stop:356 length:336 start_codon:yes stop_codon:yes gene_type:complete
MYSTNNSNDDKFNKQKNLKTFFIKLISISIAVFIVINLLFNLILAERLDKIDKILLLDKNEHRNMVKDKIRNELRDGLEKENIFNEEDKILLYKLYLKIKKEFQDIDKAKL